MRRWSSYALRRSSNEPQPLREQASLPSFFLARAGRCDMVRQTIMKKPARVMKKPAASQSGDPGDAAGWEDFQIVPFVGKPKNTEENPYLHLKLNQELKKAPAVVKHIQGGTLHTSTGCQSVKDFLRSLEKKGDPAWIQEWDAASPTQKKMIMERLKLQLDEKSVLTIKQTTTSGTRTENGVVRGWMALWEVADVEKIPFKPENSGLLKDCVANDQSKPHTNPSLAAKGWREYYHVKKKATQEINYHDDGHIADAEVTPEDEEDFESARKAIRVAGLGRAIGGSGRYAQPGLPGAFLPSTKSAKWKAEADEMMKMLGDAEVAAQSLKGELEAAMDTNPALQQKHATMAGNWAKRLANKKGLVLKTKTIASTAREDAFDKDGNKFSECLNKCKAELDEWDNDSNEGLLKKLLDF